MRYEVASVVSVEQARYRHIRIAIREARLAQVAASKGQLDRWRKHLVKAGHHRDIAATLLVMQRENESVPF